MQQWNGQTPFKRKEILSRTRLVLGHLPANGQMGKGEEGEKTTEEKMDISRWSKEKRGEEYREEDGQSTMAQ